MAQWVREHGDEKVQKTWGRERNVLTFQPSQGAQSSNEFYYTVKVLVFLPSINVLTTQRGLIDWQNIILCSLSLSQNFGAKGKSNY